MARISLLVLLSCLAFTHALRPELQKILDRINDPESRASEIINGKIYVVVHEVTLSWADAVEICNALSIDPLTGLGDPLLSMETQKESDDIIKHFNMNGLEANEFWISAQTMTDHTYSSYIWTGSGHLGKFAPNWVSDPPSVVDGTTCVFMTALGWDTAACGDQKNFICEGAKVSPK